MLKNNLISIKVKFSLAYLYAVAAKVDITVEQTPWEVDKLGIDLNLYKINKQTLEGSSFNNSIRVQLKGTSINTSMIKEKEDSYKYTLSKDMIKFPNMYFILVILPSDEDQISWLRQSENELVLFKCAYFIKVNKNYNLINSIKAFKN